MPIASIARSGEPTSLLAETSPLMRHRGATLAISIVLVALIAIADFHTGYEFRLAILYLVPIAASTWVRGVRTGLAISALAATGWFLSFHSSHSYSHAFYYYWEGGMAAVSYVVFTLLLTRLRNALARSDERFMTVLEGINAAVVVEDVAEGRVLYANPRYRETFGSHVPGGLRMAPSGTESHEFHDAAAGCWYLVQSRRLRWIDSREVCLRVLTDITAEKQAGEVLLRHREGVHRTSKLIALGEFATAIAHELGQPLAAVSTYSNTSLRLLDNGSHSPAELRDALFKCHAQAQRAGEIIRRLREFLRHRRPTLAVVDLNEVVREACSLARPEAEAAAIEFDLDLAPQLPALPADRVLIEQVILNLVRNAIEAIESAGEPVRRIGIESRALADNSVVIRVSDSGPGVPPEMLDKLFEAFSTSKPDGLGLGLGICRSVVEAHGGRIEHSGNIVRGSVFSVTLPAASASR